MRDYIYIGSTPADEPCEQAGGNEGKMRLECQTYMEQLRRLHGAEPQGAQLRIKWENHDFGRYAEVVCYFDGALPETVSYAFGMEEKSSQLWDAEALEALRGDSLHGAIR